MRNEMVVAVIEFQGAYARRVYGYEIAAQIEELVNILKDSSILESFVKEIKITTQTGVKFKLETRAAVEEYLRIILKENETKTTRKTKKSIVRFGQLFAESNTEQRRKHFGGVLEERCTLLKEHQHALEFVAPKVQGIINKGIKKLTFIYNNPLTQDKHETNILVLNKYDKTMQLFFDALKDSTVLEEYINKLNKDMEEKSLALKERTKGGELNV